MTLDLANWAEIAAAIICTTCFLYKPSVINRWFVWFLWLTIIIELGGKLSTSLPIVKNTMYSIFTGVEFAFYSIMFLKLAESRTNRKLILILQACFFVFFLYNLFFIQGIGKYNHYSTVLSSSILVFLSLLHYAGVIKSDSVTYSRWSIFFIVSGIFIFYAGTFRIYLSFNYLVTNMPKEIVWLYKLIVSNLNVILYTLFSIGFVLDAVKSQRKT